MTLIISFVAFCSEKSELVFKNHFLTILFPVDRFSEIGPSSRTFFNKNGFTCLQVLDHIHAFYQVHEKFVSLIDIFLQCGSYCLCASHSSRTATNELMGGVIFVTGEHVKP